METTAMNSTHERYKEAKDLTAKGNMKIMRSLVKDWNLGPTAAHSNNQGNSEFWKSLADKLHIDVKAARRRSCANCENGNIQPLALKAMEHIPYNKYDKDGGMRVWCEKFDFICHATRSCQAWEGGYDGDDDVLDE